VLHSRLGLRPKAQKREKEKKGKGNVRKKKEKGNVTKKREKRNVIKNMRKKKRREKGDYKRVSNVVTTG
jgi:hypothetical protein